MVDPGALLATTHQAGDGLRVRLRLCRPSDALRVQSFLEGLEPHAHEQAGEVRDFTFYDPRRKLVVAAACLLNGSETIVGLATCELLPDGPAQLVLVVDEEVDGHGVAMLLTDAVAALARRQGVTELERAA